ncbi:unnamed protein product [Sphagnum jensenii]|uniref:Chlorophyll a-b binding protein, chloroplastic n=1 Tax=Sphagnum jensenii TaxID=128206 RepID=A0ABP0VBR0_9BRYO
MSIVSGFSNVQVSRKYNALKMSFEDEIGALPPAGFWDPLGLSKGVTPETFNKRREAELKHGRVAMLAVVGYLVQEIARFPGAIDLDGTTFQSVPNGVAALSAIPAFGWFQIAASIGYWEIFGWKQNENGPVGDYGFYSLPKPLEGQEKPDVDDGSSENAFIETDNNEQTLDLACDNIDEVSSFFSSNVDAEALNIELPTSSLPASSLALEESKKQYPYQQQQPQAVKQQSPQLPLTQHRYEIELTTRSESRPQRDNEPTPKSILYPSGLASQQSTPVIPPRNTFHRGQMMSHSEVRFVTSRVLQPLETLDPYADDYYYIQVFNSISLGALRHPVPVVEHQAGGGRNQLQEFRRSLQEKSKDWAEREQVLGQQQRSSVARPREQLSLPLSWDSEPGTEDVEDGSDLVEGSSPSSSQALFSTRLWTMRRSVQRGYEALHTALELEHLLRLPLIWGILRRAQR